MRACVSALPKRYGVWNTTARNLATTLPVAPYNYASQIAFSPDRKSIAAAVSSSGQDSVLVWDAATGTRTATFILPTGAKVKAIGFSPDNTTLAASDDGTVLLFERRHRPSYNQPFP